MALSPKREAVVGPMDDRRTRFLVSPVLFVGSLLWGFWFEDPHRALCIAKTTFTGDNSLSLDLARVLLGIAAGSLVIFVAGYVIGTFTTFVLRILFPPFSCFLGCFSKAWSWSWYYEGRVAKTTLEQIWSRCAVPDSTVDDRGRRRQELSAVVAFDHGELKARHEGIHQWLVRRWSAFSIAITSAMGLLLSFFFGHYVMGILCTGAWIAAVATLCVIFVAVGVYAWRDTMKMLEFAVRLQEPPASGNLADLSSGGWDA